MATTMQELGIDRWTVEDRLALAEAIWASVEREMEQQPLTDAENRLIAERLAADEADPTVGAVGGGESRSPDTVPKMSLSITLRPVAREDPGVLT